MNFSCPSCNVLLQAEKLEEIRLWKCASCSGLVVSLPTVRKDLNPEAFKNIWQKLHSGKTEPGRPCPGCKNPLNVVAAEGQDGGVLIDVCRSCHILWFDDNEFSSLPKASPKDGPKDEHINGQEKKSESRLLTPEELAFSAFKEDQNNRRSFLYKLLDGSVSKELGIDSFFGEFFDK